MSLLVARIQGERIALVSDTKITADAGRGDAHRRTLRVYEFPLLKLAIARRDLAVGVAGVDPAGSLETAARYWDESLDTLFDALQQYTADRDVGFIIAALNPARLWHIARGVTYQRTVRGEAWEGDSEAYKGFQELYDGWEGVSGDVDFRLMSSMQRLTSPFFAQHASVGGHAIRIATGPQGFCYVPDPTATLTSPVDNNMFFKLRYAVGCGETPGAFGCFVDGCRNQILFRDKRPWEPITVEAPTIETLVERASGFGQFLEASPDYPFSSEAG